MLLDIFLIADTSNQTDLLVGERLSALFEHVGVTDVETIEDTVCVDS